MAELSQDEVVRCPADSPEANVPDPTSDLGAGSQNFNVGTLSDRTADQTAYINHIQSTAGSFDPVALLGGPRRLPTSE